MKSLIFQKASNLFRILIFGSFFVVYTACNKADPSPTGITMLPPGKSSVPTGPSASFTGSVNSSSTMNFTSAKSTSGGTTTLSGTNSFYIIKLDFPATTGPGTYFFTSAGFMASVYDGVNTYISNSTYGSGILIIDSIPGGYYYGSFNFTGELPSFATESATGNFSHL
ncbi:MAG: hypothetical protein ACLQQ4_01215 [Bacteroidia bacterium]